MANHQLMKIWGYNPTNYMCFKDFIPDETMIKDTGIGVAMKV